MEQNNYKLDDFIREQVDEAELPFKEVYWEKMEALLDREDGKAGTPWWKRGLPLLLTAVVVGTALLLYSTLHRRDAATASETVQTPAQGSHLPTDKARVDSTKNEEGPSSETEFATTTNPNLSTQDAAATNAAGTSDDQFTSVDKQDPVNSGNNSQAASPEIGPQTRNSDAMKSDAPVATANVAGNVTASSAPSSQLARGDSLSKGTLAVKAHGGRLNGKQVIKNKRQTSKGETAKGQIGQGGGGANTVQTVSGSQDVKQGVEEDAKAGTQNKSGSAGIGKQTAEQPVVVQGRSVIPRDSQTYSPRKPQDPKQTNPRFIASLENYVPEYVDSIKIIHYEPVKQTEVEQPPVVENKVKPVRPPFEAKPFELFVMAGANANFGMKGNQNRSTAVAVSPFVSLGASKQISSKLTMAAQVGFTYFNGLNSNQQVSSKVYSFGVDSTLFSVEYKKLLQMYLPISLYYEWMKNHSVLVSVGGAYAVDVSSTVNDKGNSSSVMGYRSGFNPLDIFFQLGYQVQFNERLGLGIWYQQGILDATRNSYFMNTQIDRQSRLTIGIKYTFTRSGR